MKSVDSDVKKLQDDLTEVKNNYSQMFKKEGTTFLTKDLSETIYTATNINPKDYFVELHGFSNFQTLIAVVHK